MADRYSFLLSNSYLASFSKAQRPTTIEASVALWPLVGISTANVVHKADDVIEQQREKVPKSRILVIIRSKILENFHLKTCVEN